MTKRGSQDDTMSKGDCLVAKLDNLLSTSGFHVVKGE